MEKSTLQLTIPLENNTQILKEFTIQNCLDNLSNTETFDKSNLYNCNMCGIKNRALKKTLLWKTPKILIIHIKRFLINNFGIRTQKLVNNVSYPLYDFNLTDYISIDSMNKDNSKYDLIGVNLHQEFAFFGTNAGHYTSLVKNRYDNNWYEFNDGREPIKMTKKSDIQNKNAYMLFYYKRD